MTEEEEIVIESDSEDWEEHAEHHAEHSEHHSELPDNDDPDIPLLGPVITTIRDQCTTKEEWLTVLWEYPKIYEILLGWKRWVILTQTIGYRVQHFPFNQETLDYLQSPFLDELKNLNNLSIEEAFEKVCRHGRMDLVEWLIRIFKLDVVPLTPNVFIQACAGGNLDLVQWLFSHDPETIMKTEPPRLFWGVYEACTYGHLDIVQWLVSIGPPNLARGGRCHTNPSLYWEEPFIRACQNGHLHIAKWLKENYPQICHRRFHDVAFRTACIRNHMHVARWLKEMDPSIYPFNAWPSDWGYLMDRLRQLGRTETIEWIESWEPPV